MHINLAAVCGTLTAEPVHRELRDGTNIVQFDLRTRVENQGGVGAVSVPVAWRDPSATSLASLVAGEEVLVVGRIERRFFRTAGHTQSRTELVVDRCVPARRAKSARSLLAVAASTLSDS